MAHYARLLADIQSRIHRQDGSALPPLRNSLRKSIQEAESLDRNLRDFACKVLGDLPDGTALCHFDFHPDQIMMTTRGPVVLDWMTAFQGDPQADVARTLILLDMANIAHMGWITRGLVAVARRQIHKSYLKQYLVHNEATNLTTIKKWMIPVAAARLNEKIKKEEGTIVRFLRDALGRIEAPNIHNSLLRQEDNPVPLVFQRSFDIENSFLVSNDCEATVPSQTHQKQSSRSKSAISSVSGTALCSS